MLMPTRIAILAAALVVALGFAIGFVHWNTNAYKCFDNKGFYGDWQTVYAVGKLELRVKQWGCVGSQRYDPAKFKPMDQVDPATNQ
jgi:hypothetical protein